MAKKTIGQIVTRPGRLPSDPPVSIPIAEDLLSVPGIPLLKDALTLGSVWMLCRMPSELRILYC